MRVLFLAVLEKKMSPTFLNDSTFLQSILTMNTGSATVTLSKSVPTTTKASLFFHGVADVNESVSDAWLDVRM